MMTYEEELIGLLINKQDLIPTVSIKNDYFVDDECKKIFIAIKDSYAKYKYINIQAYVDSMDIDKYMQIFSNYLYVKSDWKIRYRTYQNELIKAYKIRKTEECISKLKSKELSYDDFIKTTNYINNIRPLDDVSFLTEQELRNNLTISKKGIVFDKFPNLTRRLNLLQNDLLIIGASTGIGKSSFLLNLMECASNNYQCIYFNLEMSKTLMYRRLLAITTEKNIKDIDYPTSNDEAKTFENGIKILADRKIVFEHQRNEIKDIQAIVSQVKDVNKHTIVFIDHIGLIRASGFKSLYEQATEIAKVLRQICLEYDCTMICASQLNRTVYSAEEPNISMLKDSGEIENSARKVILLSPKNKEDNEQLIQLMQIMIAKNDSGKRGTLYMNYDKEKQIFEEVENEDGKKM